MRILVEWCDKSWKSTLIKKLSEELGMKVIKCSQPKTDNPFEEYVELFGTEKINKNNVVNDNVIFDRSWIGEQAYWPIYRNKKMKKFQVARLDKACKIAWDLIVYCTTNIWTIKKKFIEDKEDFAQVKDIGRIQRYFVKTIKWLTTPVIQYDWQVTNPDSIIYIIRELMNTPLSEKVII